MSLAVGAILVVVSLQESRPVDWPDRRELGVELHFEWEYEAWTTRDGGRGGGSGIARRGKLVDRTFGREGGDWLVLREFKSDEQLEGWVRFVRLRPDGSVVEDAPLEAFTWRFVRDEAPYQDPLEGPAGDFMPGTTRTRTLRPSDRELRAFHPGPIEVQERVTVEAAAEGRFWLVSTEARTVTRSWRDARGPGQAGPERLLAFDESCVFSPDSGHLGERELLFTSQRAEDTTLESVKVGLRLVHVTDLFPYPELEREALLLRDAWRVALTDPSRAQAHLVEWSRLRSSYELEGVASRIWRLVSRAERELQWVRAELSAQLAPVSGAELEAELLELMHRARLSGLFAGFGLDSAFHRAAYAGALERRALPEPLRRELLRLHDELAAPYDDVPDALREEGPALLARALAELER